MRWRIRLDWSWLDLVVVAAFDRCALLSIWKAEVHVGPSDVMGSILLSNPNYPTLRYATRDSPENIVFGYKRFVLIYTTP